MSTTTDFRSGRRTACFAYLKIMLLLVAATALPSCENGEGQYVDVPLQVEVPANFPPMAYDLEANPPTQKGFELGRKLFYDGRLSSDGIVSCAFCHIQKDAFTHHGHTISHGVDNQAGTRNAPPIQNLAFQKVYMWDGAVSHLDLQPLLPLTSPVEMNGDLAAAVALMKRDARYRQLFGQAFPGKEIDTEHLLKALGQFMVMVISADSRFDHYRRNEPGGALSAEELSGYALFQAKCAGCHATDLMTDDSFRNNGLAVNPLVNDVGRYRVTERLSDYCTFKVPSLRNVEKTAPYMHDGRFASLEAVMNHYAGGVVDSPTLDPLLKQGSALGIPLTATEKKQLIAFLKTLTDERYLNDPRFSEP